jgi:uncharacterized protein
MKILGFNISRSNNKAIKNNQQVIPGAPADLNSMLGGIFDGVSYGTDILSMPYGLGGSNQYNPLTLNRILLSYSYMTHGPIQTMIDQPVEDAFRGGIDVKSEELDEDDRKLLKRTMEDCGDITAIKDVMRWCKLFGGSGLIINTNQDPAKELNSKIITENDPLSFIAADRWELTLAYMWDTDVECPYNYYGQPLHKTRVIKVLGKEAPSFIRRRLQGWGFSEIERTIRPINQYVKEEDLIYQLLDEAKIDVYKIKGFNASLLSNASGNALKSRFQLANLFKNFHSAITMDIEDDYQQKQLTFAGLAEMMKMIQVNIAAAIRMPMTKLFGLSASGFNSGEDDIENYNALVESEVRAKAKEVLMQVIPLRCQQIFGFVPEDLEVEFKPLRVLSAEQEENVKTQKFNRISALYSQGMFDGQEYDEELRTNNLISIETKVGKGVREPEPPQPSLQIDIPQKPVTGKVPEPTA